MSVSWFDRRREAPEGSILLYGGGGNLVLSYRDARDLIAASHARVSKLVILPHTIRGNEDLLSELGPNVDIITREQVSFNHVRQHARKAQVLLMDDLALSLDPRPLLEERVRFLQPFLSGKLPGKSGRRLLSRLLFHRWLVRPANSKGDCRILNAFRRDGEAGDIAIPPRNFDLSRMFAFGTDNETVCTLASSMLLQTLDRFSRIRTNRLHIAIAGALLDKDVEFHANSYDKNEAVYRHSLARFSKVRWMG